MYRQNPDDSSPSIGELCQKGPGKVPCETCLTLVAEQTPHGSNHADSYRLNLLSQINTQHDPFILRLPVELAERIFVSCLPYTHSLRLFSQIEDDWDEEYNSPMPFILARVCSQWRHIALATPRLWNIISINLNPHPQRCDLPQWFKRSGKSPLYIRIYSQTGALYDIPRTLRTVIELVNGCSHRWRVLELHLPTTLFARFSGNENSQSVSLGRLKLFPVVDADPDYNESDEEDSSSFPYTTTRFRMSGVQPQPQHLVVRKVRIGMIHIGWSRLIHLDATSIDLVDVVNVLKCSPNLERCTLEDVRRIERSSDPLRAFTHPTVTYLDVFNHPCHLLNYFTFPSLKQLHVDASETPIPSIEDFLDRSNVTHTLQHLTISNTDDLNGEEELFQLLSRTTALTRLSLVELPLGDRFFDLFSRRPEGEALHSFLPHLRFLRIKGFRDFPWESISTLFESEYVGRPLRKVEFELSMERLIDEPVLRKMQVARWRGLVIRVTDFSGRDLIDKSHRHFSPLAGQHWQVSSSGSMVEKIV